jgi:hypothetical protein
MGDHRTFWLTGKKARWLFVDALIPVILVLIIWWPTGSWLLEKNGFVFERVVGGGDLLAISFAFLMAYLTEQSLSRPSRLQNDTTINVVQGITMLIAMIAAVSYGAIKIYHTTYGFPADKAGQISVEISSMAQFSLVFCIFTIGYIYVAKSWFEKIK